MGRIRVPTFLVGSFQDEQTSGHFASSLHKLRRNPRTWLNLQNGVHADSLGPSSITRWVEFLELYVADEVPRVPDQVLGLSSALYTFLADAPAAPVQQSRFAGGTDVAAARATFEQDPRVRLMMDNGAGPAGPGSIGAAWELGFDAWPIPEAAATDFFLGAGGALTPAAPAAGTAEYLADPGARPATTLPGEGEADAWKAQPPYDWAPLADGKGVGFATPPLPSDVVIAGGSSLYAAPLGLGRRHRPPGHAERDPARRRGRPTYRTAGCAPRTATATRRAARSSRSRAPRRSPRPSRSSPSRTPSAPARASASRSRRPAATGRAGASTPSTTARRA